MKTKFSATYIIRIKGVTEGDGKKTVTAQMMRDKIMQVLQEMWVLGHVTGAGIEEVDENEDKKVKWGDV